MGCGKRTQHKRGKEEFKFIPRRGPASPDYIGKRESSRKEVSRREMGLVGYLRGLTKRKILLSGILYSFQSMWKENYEIKKLK